MLYLKHFHPLTPPSNSPPRQGAVAVIYAMTPLTKTVIFAHRTHNLLQPRLVQLFVLLCGSSVLKG